MSERTGEAEQRNLGKWLVRIVQVVSACRSSLKCLLRPCRLNDVDHSSQCIIAPLSRNVSSYSFYIASHLVDWARDNGVDTVQIEQICAKPRKRNEGDLQEDGDEPQLDDSKISYIHDQTLEGDIEVSSMKGLTKFRGEGLHKVSEE